MLKVIRLPFEEDGSWWTVCPITGSLIRHQIKPEFDFDEVPPKVKDALKVCDDPYSCTWTHIRCENAYGIESLKFRKLNKLHERLLWISNRRFLISRIYASIRCSMFDTTYQAMGLISQIPEQVMHREERCFQRSLLAAKTSKSFQKNGVLFIGAMTSNSDMHAWIIEDGCQPDHEDRGWVNYRPLLALVANEK